jgi:phosphatidylinositol-3-phosphatase
LREARVTLPQLALVSVLSAAVSALIVISALGETDTERAVIAALGMRSAILASAAERGQPGVPTASAAPAAPTDNAALGSADSGTGTGGGGSSGLSSDSGLSSSSSGASDSGGSGGSGGSEGSPGSGAGATSGAANAPATGSTAPASKIKHVFVIVVGTASYEAAFGHGSAARYLNSRLRPKGELLSEYHTLAASPLPDLVAMISGQPPNSETLTGCPVYSEFPRGSAPDKNGLVPGSGCVYPNTALTIGDQMDSAPLPWRGYIGGMNSPCLHPNSGAVDALGTGGYATSANPFVYFHSLLDLGDCQSDDLPYGRLTAALASSARTPSYSFITPDPCDAGASATCPNGQAPGIAAADAFLQRAVPPILSSPAYRASGALVIVFTAAPAGATPSAGTTTGPAASGAAAQAAGGAPVRTGALVLSPYTRAGTIDAHAYDPYSVLRSVEDVFGLAALGRTKSARAFDHRVFSR